MKKSYSICYIVSFVLLASIVPAFTQTSPQTTQQPAQTAKQQNEYEFLKQQTQRFQEFIQKEREEHRKFLEDVFTKIIGGTGIFVTLFLALITFWGFRTKKDIAKTVVGLYREHGLQIIDEHNTEIRLSLAELQSLLDKETAYYNKSILFLTAEADRQKFEQRELAIIADRGIKNYRHLTDVDEAMPLIKNQAFDVVVYYYNPAGDNPEQTGDPKLRELLQILDARRAKTPLLIYTYEKGRNNQLYGIDIKEVVAYPYAVFTNFPITLVNLLHTVANYFPLKP